MADAQYTINYDEKRHFKNIEFTEGKFIGVSVLGNDQTPAFTGSQFFDSNSDFEEKMNLLKEYCEKKNGQESQEKIMEIKNYSDFMKLSWGEVSTKVADTISKEYGNEAYTVIADMDNDFAYAMFYSYIDGSCDYYRVSYSIDENGTVALGEAKKVHRVWEIIDEPEKVESTMEAKPVEEAQVQDKQEVQEEKAEEATKKEDEKSEEESSKDEKSEEEESSEDEKPEGEESKKEEKEDKFEEVETSEESSASVVEDQPIAQEQFESEEITVDNNHQESPSEEEVSSSTSTSVEGEKEQFDALKLEEKVNLLNSYKDQLGSDKYGEFMSNIMDFESKNDLEVSVLKSIISLKEETSSNRRAFSYAYVNNSEKKGDTGDDWVRRALRR